MIEEVANVIDSVITLTKAQLKVFLSSIAIVLAIAGIRGGKTHVGALKTIFYAMEHPCLGDECHLVCSPTYQMSRVPVEKIFRLLYDKKLFPICPLVKYRRADRTFVLAANGGGVTYITVRSTHDPDKMRGIKALSAWLDEAAYMTLYAWQVIQGRLADSNGPCWVTTTPAGYNWVYELYEKARNGDKTIKVVHWESTENTFVSQEGISRLADRFDSRTHTQEVKARFVRGRGLVYYPFHRKTHVRPYRVDPHKPLIVGQDFNVDPMCSILGQPILNTRGQESIHWFHCRKDRDSSTFNLVTWLDMYIAELGIKKSLVTIYADAAGNARSTAGKSDFRILRDGGYTVSAPPKNPMIKDRVNCVNGLLLPAATKVPRMFFTPDCVPVIESLEKQIWEINSDPPTPDKKQGFDHFADALGYPCWRLFPLKSVMTVTKKAA